MTGRELLELLQDPELCQGVRAALGLPSGSVAESLRELAAEVKGLAAGQKELAAAQVQIEASVREPRISVGTLPDFGGFGLDVLAAIVLPAQLERDERTILTTGFERRSVTTAAGEEEVDLWAEGERDGAPVLVVGEVKSRIYATDVKRFVQKAERVEATLETPVLRLMFGFVVHPAAREVAEQLGVRAVASSSSSTRASTSPCALAGRPARPPASSGWSGTSMPATVSPHCASTRRPRGSSPTRHAPSAPCSARSA
jgi:hypothetical protein